MESNQETELLAIALYTINRHAKTATDKRELYSLKRKAIEKLLSEGRAKKIGLHFVEDPKRSQQHSTVLVKCGDFLFHTTPQKEDFNTLPHLGELDHQIRNPKKRMNVRTAKEIITRFVGFPDGPRKEEKRPKKKKPPLKNRNIFTSSYLDGK